MAQYMPIGDFQPEEAKPSKSKRLKDTDETHLVVGLTSDDSKQMVAIGFQGPKEELLQSLVHLGDNKYAFIVSIDAESANKYARAVRTMAKQINSDQEGEAWKNG